MIDQQLSQTSTRRFNAKRETILAATAVQYYYRKKEDRAMECIMRSIAAQDQLAKQAAQAADAEQRVRTFMQLHAQMLAAHDNGERAALIYFNDIRALPPAHVSEAFTAYSDMFRSARRLLEAPPTGTPGARFDRAALNARTHILLSAAHWMRAWIAPTKPTSTRALPIAPPTCCCMVWLPMRSRRGLLQLATTAYWLNHPPRATPMPKPSCVPPPS